MKTILSLMAVLIALVWATPADSQQRSIGPRLKPRKTDCATHTSNGATCWDHDDQRLFVGDGTNAISLGGTQSYATIAYSGEINDEFEVLATSKQDLSGVCKHSATNDKRLCNFATSTAVCGAPTDCIANWIANESGGDFDVTAVGTISAGTDLNATLSGAGMAHWNPADLRSVTAVVHFWVCHKPILVSVAGLIAYEVRIWDDSASTMSSATGGNARIAMEWVTTQDNRCGSASVIVQLDSDDRVGLAVVSDATQAGEVLPTDTGFTIIALE